MNEIWNNIDCEWVPLVRVGEFKFASPVNEYVDEGLLRFEPSESDVTGWEQYLTPGDPDGDNVTVYTEEGQIISIHCESECLFQGQNLIGMTLDQVVQLLNCKPSEDVDQFEMFGGPQDVYNFEELAAQVWVRAGIVVCVIVGDDPED